MVMMKKLSPPFIELTQDACLKAFWRRRALRAFLKQHHISDSQLASWAEDESKRDFLARLFDALIGVKDNKGYTVILSMARSLAEMKHFPDLENWEDSSEKISNAHKAIARLKSQVDELNEQVRDEKESREWRKRAAEDRERQVASQRTLRSLEEELKELLTKVGTQEGGYAFEKWFYKLVAYAEMVARPPYKDPDGRQIDGSVTLDGTTFLMEAKFTAASRGNPAHLAPCVPDRGSLPERDELFRITWREFEIETGRSAQSSLLWGRQQAPVQGRCA